MTAADDTWTRQDTTSGPPDPRRWLALVVVLVASFMDLLDVTIVNVAIPSIQRDLNARYAQIQWIVAGYALAFAATLITGGRLGDILGRKRLFLAGMTGFTAGSALCGLAMNPDMLIAARFFQGAMAALMIPQVLAIIHVTFGPAERGKVFGIYGGVAGTASVAGPVLGGLLVQWNIAGWQWRPIFLVNIPVGIAGLLLAVYAVRESRAPFVTRLDVGGAALATAGVGMLAYPLTEGRDLGWPDWSLALMAGSVPVFALLVLTLRGRVSSPLIVLSLFRIRSFAAGLVVALVFWVAFGGFFLTWMIYMQAGLRWTPLHAGVTGIAFAVPTATAAGLSVQVLVPRFGRGVLLAGAVTAAAGFATYRYLTGHFGAGIHSWQMIVPLAVTGIGFGLIVAPLIDLVLSGVPRSDAGSASGLLNTVQQLGVAFGIALIGTIFFGRISGAGSFGSFGSAFGVTLWYDVGAMALVFLLMFALPKRTAASG